MSDTENGRRRRTLLTASVAAGVLLAGGGGVYLAGSAAGEDSRPAASPAPGTAGGGGTPGGSDGASGIAPGEPDPGGGPAGTVYTAKGPLPQGPSSAAVHRPEGLVTSAEVTRLAAALGVPGTPVLEGKVWTVRPEKDATGPRLDVTREAPGSWTYSWQHGGPVGDACLKGPACPPPGEGHAPIGRGKPVSEAAAKAAAAPVLKALGQDDAKVRATQVMDGSVRVVNADPVVGGLPTYGWSTGLHIGPDGRPVAGSGTLKEPVRGETRPVVPAEKALAQLNEASKGSGPVGIGGCATDPPAVADDGRAEPAVPCPPSEPVAPREVPVTGAVLGLAAQDEAGERLLVPTWLFTADPADAAPYTVTRSAVVPERAEPPATGAPEEGTAPVRKVESYRTDAGGRKLTVTFWGGVCSTYTATAEETGGKVAVRISEKPIDPDRMCVMVAKEISLTVTLDAPLGGRAVVDAESGQAVPRR
ncbi:MULTISPECIES: hypothetical protein [unclassified Streptomyces]|uniref:hypothetical protein n=1 Tax=unclassified Streptomyces TaxID=2593676 RepID=UPI0036A404A0